MSTSSYRSTSHAPYGCRFTEWTLRIRRRRHKERIAALRAALSSVMPAAGDAGEAAKSSQGGEQDASPENGSSPSGLAGCHPARHALHAAVMQPARLLTHLGL